MYIVIVRNREYYVRVEHLVIWTYSSNQIEPIGKVHSYIMLTW